MDVKLKRDWQPLLVGSAVAAGCFVAWNAMFPDKSAGEASDAIADSNLTAGESTVDKETKEEKEVERILRSVDDNHFGPRAHGFALTQLVERNAQCFGDRVACIHPDGSQTTYATFAKRVATVGTSLRRVLGLGARARVAVLAPNSVEYLELFFAIAWAGGWIVPINIRFSAADVTAMLIDCSCEVSHDDFDFNSTLMRV
jgi:non-ribosomal peptide synthetase component F